VKRQHVVRLVRLGGSIAAVALLLGCAPMDRFHGFVPPQEEIDTLQIGVTSREEIENLFGPPMAERTFTSNTIYYASSHFQRFGPFAPEVVDRQVLAIDLDSADRVRNLRRYTLEDGRVVTLNRRGTDDGIADVSFLQQLLGSFGRIDAGALLGEQ